MNGPPPGLASSGAPPPRRSAASPPDNTSPPPPSDFPSLPNGEKLSNGAIDGSTSTSKSASPNLANPGQQPLSGTTNGEIIGGVASASDEPLDDIEKFGMNGLLSVIRMENNDETAVAIGSDLGTLGFPANRYVLHILSFLLF